MHPAPISTTPATHAVQELLQKEKNDKKGAKQWADTS